MNARWLNKLQAFIQFFFKELKRKKVVKVSKGRTRNRRNPTAAAQAEEVVTQSGEDLTPEEEELVQLLDSSDEPAVDKTVDSQDVHDTHVARSVRDKAIQAMELQGVFIDPEQNRAALGLFPKARACLFAWSTTNSFAAQVAGLAKKVHDSGTISDSFNSLVDAAKGAGQIESDKTALDRRCPTRWNSDLACLDAHNILRPAVEQLTATSALKLSAFKLTDEQWSLSDEVTDVLSVGYILFMLR